MKSKVTAEAREVNDDDDNKGNPKIVTNKRVTNTEKGSTIRSNSKGKRRREILREQVRR